MLHTLLRNASEHPSSYPMHLGTLYNHECQSHLRTNIAFNWGQVYCVHEKSLYEHTLLVFRNLELNSSKLRFVTCLLMCSEIAEATEVHFSVDGKLIYCNFINTVQSLVYFFCDFILNVWGECWYSQRLHLFITLLHFLHFITCSLAW